MDIKTYISEVNKNGFSKPSNYDVIVFGPAGVADLDMEKRMSMRCLATELPGRDLQTIEHSHYGPNKKVASNSIYTDVTLTFILSRDHKEKEYFEKWFDLIVGPHRVSGSNETMYDLGFYDDYIGTVDITQYDEKNVKKQSTTLEKAFPISIGTVNLSWDQGNQFITLPVRFTYRYYKSKLY